MGVLIITPMVAGMGQAQGTGMESPAGLLTGVLLLACVQGRVRRLPTR
ncbi:hypothetical protein ACTMU2_36410 [Cupriavidus basilensis]